MPKICIDIGHGKNTYPPSKGVGDFAEWFFNNAVGKLVIPMLEKHGFEVYLSQPLDDVSKPLKQRVRDINDEECDLVISIHANWNDNPECEGHWVFYWYNAKDSLKLAQIWQKHANNILPNKDMGVTPCEPNTWTDFGICRDTDMAAILLEHAFYSNSKDLELLKDNNFRNQCAEVITKTVCEYFWIECLDNDISFTDIEDHWAEDYIEKVTGSGLMSGYHDGTFRPDETMTRAELATVLAKLKGD